MNIFAMLTRLLTRRALSWGVRRGIGRLTRTGRKPVASAAKAATPAAAQAKSHRAAAKRARQAAKLTRRIGR